MKLTVNKRVQQTQGTGPHMAVQRCWVNAAEEFAGGVAIKQFGH
jgi:hypothetical protein